MQLGSALGLSITSSVMAWGFPGSTSARRLCPGSLPPRLHRAPSSHLLHLRQSSLRLVFSPHSHQHHLSPLAPTRLLITTSPPGSPGPSLSPGLSIHRTPPRSAHFPPSPLSVRLKIPSWLLPPSVSPWVTFLLAISCVALGSHWLSAPPRILPPSTPPFCHGHLSPVCLLFS